MAEVIHEHKESNGSGMNFFWGILGVVIVLLLLFYFGLPLIRNMGSGNPQINVPGQVDVNIDQPQR